MEFNAENIRTEIRKFIVDSYLLGDESVKFTDSDSFMRRGIIDSMGILELTAFLEQQYSIAVADMKCCRQSGQRRKPHRFH